MLVVFFRCRLFYFGLGILDVLSKRDGLTTSGMELKGFAGNMVSLFFKPEDSKKSSFVNKGVERTAKQVVDCGGWIVIGNNQNNPIDCVS